MTDPRPTGPRPADAAAPALRVEDDPPPVVRALAKDLAARLEDPGFAATTRGLRGTVSLRDADTPQAVAIRLDDQGVSLAHGAAEGAELRATVDLRGEAESTLDGETEHPQLARWLRDLLSSELPEWPEAAARFWSMLAAMPGAPEALLVVELPSGEERRFGAPDGRAYELHGDPEGLARVLCGRVSPVEAAFAGTVFVRGSFPELSVLSGAGFRIRYGTGDEAGADD